MTAGRHDRGQAVVEFAIALPLVVVLVLGVVQVAVIVRDQLAIELAAREGARAAAVSASPASAAGAAAEAATGLEPIDTATTVGPSTVTVTVSHTTRTRVPLLGLVIGDVALDASVTMRREPP
jgi:Flp pilus assembly protein TadG